MPRAKTSRSAICAAAMLLCTVGAAAAASDIGCSIAGKAKALSFGAAALVTDDKSEPGDIHLKKDDYRVDEPLRFFLVPAGYGCIEENGRYRASFVLSVQLIYRGGVVVDQPDIKTFDFHAEEMIESIKINMDDKITGLIPGAFALKVTLADTIGDGAAEVILPFTVAR